MVLSLIKPFATIAASLRKGCDHMSFSPASHAAHEMELVGCRIGFVVVVIIAIVGVFAMWATAKNTKQRISRQYSGASIAAMQLKPLPRDQWKPVLEKSETAWLVVVLLGDGYVLEAETPIKPPFLLKRNGQPIGVIWGITPGKPNKITGPYVLSGQ